MQFIKNKWFIYLLGGIVLGFIAWGAIWLIIKDHYREFYYTSMKRFNITFFKDNTTSDVNYLMYGDFIYLILFVYILPIALIESLYVNILLIIDRRKWVNSKDIKNKKIDMLKSKLAALEKN